MTHAIGGLRANAARRGLPVTAEVRDLETGAAGLGSVCFDVIVVVHYLHRPLVPVLADALAFHLFQEQRTSRVVRISE